MSRSNFKLEMALNFISVLCLLVLFFDNLETCDLFSSKNSRFWGIRESVLSHQFFDEQGSNVVLVSNYVILHRVDGLISASGKHSQGSQGIMYAH